MHGGPCPESLNNMVLASFFPVTVIPYANNYSSSAAPLILSLSQASSQFHALVLWIHDLFFPHLIPPAYSLLSHIFTTVLVLLSLNPF